MILISTMSIIMWIDPQVPHEYLKCLNCAAPIEISSAQVSRKYVRDYRVYGFDFCIAF